MRALRQLLRDKLPAGFVEVMSYGVVGYVVPHTLYPAGYHVNPALPLPFIGLAAQKNFIALYHLGLYADAALLAWFTQAHAKASTRKLDMGKSCIRYKAPGHVPLALIGELAGRVTAQRWIEMYEAGRGHA